MLLKNIFTKSVTYSQLFGDHSDGINEVQVLH